jgi:anti-sigma B factor antagonist
MMCRVREDPGSGAPVGPVDDEPPGAVVVDPPAGGVLVLRVAGALDLVLAPKLQRAAEHAARSAPRLTVVDLSEVTFLASIGMAVLLRMHRERPPGTTVRLVADSSVVLRPLQLTRLADELEIVPTTSAALAGFGR